MAKARIIVGLLVGSDADAVTVRDAIAQFLTDKDKFAVDAAPVVSQDETGVWHVRADVRFNVRLDAENWKSDIQAKWSGSALANRILPGSRVSFHMCPHEQPESTWSSCRDLTWEYAEAVK